MSQVNSFLPVALSTRRSKERAYLMHYAWGIAQGQISPAAVPQMYGIDIRWDYGDDAVSQQAAKAAERK